MLTNEFNGMSTKFPSNIINNDQLSNQTIKINKNKQLKQRIKCKDDVNEQKKISKRKRRRRHSTAHDASLSTDIHSQKVVVESMTNIEVQPLLLVSNDQQVFKEMLLRSSKSKTTTKTTTTTSINNNNNNNNSNENKIKTNNQYHQRNSDMNADVRVRRAFLWIKVDMVKNNQNRNHKIVNKTKLRNNRLKKQFRLWVFRIVEPQSNKVIIRKQNI